MSQEPMRSLTVGVSVKGPWSLDTSRRFWEGFTPQRLPASDDGAVRTSFVSESDWLPVSAVVTTEADTTSIEVCGAGDLESASDQVRRFLALDIDATDWPAVADRDPVIADAQRTLPGLRSCGFHSPYEAAAWSILSQRVRMSQAASLRQDLVQRIGAGGAFPAPETLRTADLDLPGRKAEYLRAVAEAAIEGLLSTAALRAMDTATALAQLQTIHGVGPFAAELILVRGANAPDVLPTHEGRLMSAITQRYGADRAVEDIADAWRPFRTWASVHLRAMAEPGAQGALP